MLEIRHLAISFTRSTTFHRRQPLPVVTDVCLTVDKGQVVAVIGASGAGKSLIAHALLGLLPKNGSTTGEILFKGTAMSAKSLATLRGRSIALIPQAVSHLNPLRKAGRQVQRAAMLSGCTEDIARQRTEEALARYRLTTSVRALFPFQLSGGMARRVLTATATAGQAELVIADEPTTGLDPRVAWQTVLHLRALADGGKGVLLITHDLEYAVEIADTLVVLHQGMMVETIPARTLAEGSLIMHPYTRALWQALPANGFHCLPPARSETASPRAGCTFASFCKRAEASCIKDVPPLRRINNRLIRCNHAAG